ncbi:LppX_LprAFG lipoprotein [Actinomadura graeca]|uniref:LppX_LprAFG lipoprotein n=1 Tax=Actinomadura graeca TaxID=2750812 RepID=A0ABX8R822_9ACTN|nr:LppX_LprAFG lipoprotein [Actinomadura graeca]QXJ25148.1 LppX_LprAFG lipoprotein [Actinomadura graeca]
MSRRFLALAPVLLALVAATACDRGGSGPAKADFDAAGTLRQASAAMAAVTSVGLTMDSEGEPPVSVRGGDMKLLRNGDAQGTLTMRQSGMNVEMKVVASGSSVYLDAGTGGWQKVPRALAALKYDPSAVLDPERGIAGLLGSLQAPKAEAVEKVDGKEAYRVAARLPKDRVKGLLPGVETDVDGKVWVRKADGRLVKVRGTFPGGKGTVVVAFTEFDVPYKISAPK